MSNISWTNSDSAKFGGRNSGDSIRIFLIPIDKR